ncbi:TetR/AcrR family transcriptional regulator [Marinobacter piscensis]|uniref:TetR/AcrR family transcriptional regulator n=1 Tax=Marinobacter piscensis TaxID=1562308 RepID=UPI0011A5FA42|nr:TetR/AcrR family transcriptional regulator [Marinobacter piscensis]
MEKTRPGNLPAEQRRNATVEAVVDLAATTNPGDITTAAIARHMKLTQGALFRHFPNKDAIWQAVMEWVAKHLMSRLDKAATGIESPLATMQAMFMAHIAFVSEHPGAPRMLFGELQGARATPAKRLAHAMLTQYAGRLNTLIETAKQRGELPPDTDNHAAAILFIGTIQGLIMQSLMSGDMDQMRRDAPGVFAIYRRGIVSEEPGGDQET